MTFTDGAYVSTNAERELVQTGTYEMLPNSRIIFVLAGTSRGWVARYELDSDVLTRSSWGPVGERT